MQNQERRKGEKAKSGDKSDDRLRFTAVGFTAGGVSEKLWVTGEADMGTAGEHPMKE